MATPIKTSRIDVNVLVGSLPESDRDLFFGPLDGSETWIELDSDARWPDIMSAAGIFPSKSQARKNGWDKEVEPGFTHIKVGKLKHCITVLKEGFDE